MKAKEGLQWIVKKNIFFLNTLYMKCYELETQTRTRVDTKPIYAAPPPLAESVFFQIDIEN